MNAPIKALEQKSIEQRPWIGASVPRPNARRLVEGAAVYIDDIRLPKMLHICFVRSQYAHALIKSIDTQAASKAKGVVAIYTGADLMKHVQPMVATLAHFKGMKAAAQHCLAVDRVCWQGEPMVAIVANSRHEAEDAAQLVIVDYEELPVVTDMETALDENAYVIHPELGTNLCFERVVTTDTYDDISSKADFIVERTFRFPRHTGVCLEGRSVIGDFSAPDGRLTVYISHQAPHMIQDCYARLLGLTESAVRVICRDVGGSYGIKTHVYGDELATCAISMDLGRPVKFVADRAESFVSDIHSRDHRVLMRMAVNKDGAIKGISFDDRLAIGPYSVYPRTSVVEGNQIVNITGQWYQHESYHASMTNVYTNMAVYSNYRAVGHPVAVGITEGIVDVAARTIGMDPIEFRRKNLLRDNNFPCVTPSGMKFEGMSHEKCLDKIIGLMDLEKLRKEQIELRKKNIYRGIGVISMIEITNPSAMFYGVGGARISAQDGCTIRMEPSGSIVVLNGTGEQGQGTETVFAQIAADAVGVHMSNVKVVGGDTDATPYGGGTWASRAAGVGGEATLQAGLALRENILKLAAVVLETKSELLDIRNGSVFDRLTGQDRTTLADLGRIAYFRPDTLGAFQAELCVTRHFVPKDYPFTFTNGSIACHLEVDVETGFIKLLKFWVVEDCGTILNEQLVDEQIRGALVQGIGPTLYEQCLYDERGQMLNGNMADYIVPFPAEMPDIVIGHVCTPTKSSQLGAKGAGEAGTAGAPAAILNALNDALAPFNVELFDMPFTPEKVLRSLGRI
jgi:carbon-monoxide dehydrogenase large subunit